MIQFTDPNGNPLPAGVHIFVYEVPTGYETATPLYSQFLLLGDDWTQAGGYCPNLVATNGQVYAAVFVGRQAPVFAQQFTGAGDPTVVACSKYQSPSMLTVNWASFVTETLWPKGVAWWGDDYLQPGGGVAWAIAYGIAAIIEWLDSNSQNQLQASRIQSSQDFDVDTWTQDFLGTNFPRYLNETDLAYKTRVYAILASPKTTLACILLIVTMFYNAVAMQLGAAFSNNLAFDELGGFDTKGGFDTAQGFSPYIPPINVWDRQSRPGLANQFNINPHNNDGSFVIQIGAPAASNVGWFLDRTYLDFNAFLIGLSQWSLSEVAPDPRLAALVNFVKAGGSKPLYLTAIGS